MTTIDPAAAAAADTIAQFEGPSSALDSMQRWLHRHPLASPSLVLLLAAVYFSPVHRELLHGAQPVHDPRPGHDHRHPRRRPDARRAHCRHRPVRRIDHRPVLGRDGQAGPRLGLRAADGPAPGHCHRDRLRGTQRWPGDAIANTAVHRHPRDVQHSVRPQPVVLRERDVAQPGPQGAGVDPAVVRPHVGADQGIPGHVRLVVHARPVRRGVVPVATHGVGPSRLRHRRRSRGGAPCRDPDQPGADVGVPRKWLDLRHRRVAVDQPHRHGVPEAAGERQPRLDHRRRDRRHEPVRRAGQRVRFAARRPHRRRVRQRALSSGGGAAVADVRHRRARHRRRGDGPVDQDGSRHDSRGLHHLSPAPRPTQCSPPAA